MPPKKQAAGSKAGTNAASAVDEDLSDVALLPQLNEFVFCNFYAFKYRRNQQRLEQQLMKVLYKAPEGETAEESKRQKVIQQADLLNQAKAKGYLTEEEASDLVSVDAKKVRQVLARTTNEILASITVPLRRFKAEEADRFKERFDKISDEAERQAALEEKKQAANAIELTVWLKDFPRSAEDFKELRRSGAQHQPEIEVALQGLFMVEEEFERDDDEEEDSIGVPRNEELDNKSEDEAEEQKKIQLFTKEDRIAAFQDLVYLNRFARNCSATSQMRLLTVQKFKFAGPDPPAEPLQKEVEEQEETKAPAAKGKAKEEAPVEVELTPEEAAELKLFDDFIESYVEGVNQVKADLSEYRAMVHPETGVERVALWPKTFTQKELEKMKQEHEEKMRKEEEAEAEKRRLEEEKQAAAPAKKGGAPAKKGGAADARGASRGGVSSAASNVARPKHNVIEELLKKQKLTSQDDQEKNFDFSQFERVMTEMGSASTNVGGILAAMVYQIEQDNAKMPKGSAAQGQHEQSLHEDKSSMRGGNSMSGLPSALNSIEHQSDQIAAENERAKLGTHLDDLYNALVFEHGVMTTDYSHQFKGDKVDQELKGSPYQNLFNEADRIGINDAKFTFMDGSTTAVTENKTLKKMDLPGINDRFKMPATATRTQAERESDTQAILKLYPNVTHQGKRLLVLKAFEQLLKEENPERDFTFEQRNFTEEMDANAFRQTLVEAMRLCPDVLTQYFDKEDALLLALNFKNPPGRLLRRQWTYPVKTVPDIQTWRQFIKDEKCEMVLPALDIPTHKVGMLRVNQKFCFPCDNSVIRIDKHQVAGRRFGATVIIKDNMVFGIKEDATRVAEKVAGEDELPSQETKKASNRDSEFWLEFENKARLHIAMLEPAEAEKELIPPQSNEDAKSTTKRAELGTVTQLDSIENVEEGATISGVDAATQGESKMQKSSLAGGATQPPDKSENQQTIESSLKEPKDSSVAPDTKTVTIDVEEQPEEAKTSLHDKQQSQMSKSQINFDPNYEADRGASMTFTYQEGLVVQVHPNGNIQQNIIKNDKLKSKNSVLANDTQDEKNEVYRVITRQAQVIRQLKDGNQIIYFPDGTITTTDHRRGIWKTTNSLGVVRERNLRTGVVKDEMQRLSIHEKIDPETNAVVQVREDGLLKVIYPDRRTLLVLPDHTQILITKSGPQEEGSAVTTTLFKKEGYAPVKITSDPVKARAGTIIGLGGTDALMGKDSIMERSYGGLISETYLPDRSVIQTYLEKQELPGYNKFSTSLIHLLKRDDYSMIKIRQDGEVVIITANERKYLNSIGKEMEFGVNDYDYFFELFGVPSERRSGVYTANLEQGRIWTEDEEGNHFIIYANGDSTEKLSVSFNLDQMVEGIDNKEPSSPRIADGEYIEDECKFLPPPKTVSHPRLFLVRESGAMEFLNEEQLEYLFMCNAKDSDVIVSQKSITRDNERAKSHFFMRKQKSWTPDNPTHLPRDSIPRMPQALDMVNQTVSIATEPESSTYLWRNILEYSVPSEVDLEKFQAAIQAKDLMRQQQHKQHEDLKIEKPQISKAQLTNQCRIMLRMARQRGVDVQKLIGDEYKQVKVDDRDERRQAVLETLEDHFRPESEAN